MGEEFHKNYVLTNCCLICGPTTRKLQSIINSKKLSKAFKLFIDSDLSDPNLPPHCCDNCRGKYEAYYEKHTQPIFKIKISQQFIYNKITTNFDY